MKNTLLTCIILLWASLTASSQKLFEKPLVFGVKIGFNASLFTDDVNSFDPSSPRHDNSFGRYVRASPLIGFTIDYTISKQFYLGTEILYNTRGMAYRQANDNVVMIRNNKAEQAYNYFKYKIEYIEVPLTAHYNFLPPVHDNWLTFYAGVAPAVAVSKQVKFDYPEINAGPGKEPDDESADLQGVKSFNTSLLGGLQFGSRPSVIGYFIDLRTSYTLLPTFNAKTDVNGDNLNTKMLSFSLGLGLKF